MNERQEREDRLVAGISHASLMVPLGFLVPIIIWLTQRERSEFLRFQALQALAYQLLGLLVKFVIAGCYMVSIFLIIPLSLSAVDFSRPGTFTDEPFSGGIVPMLFSAIFIIVMALFFIGGPVYVIVGIVATVRVLKGHDYRYPILGKWLAGTFDLPPSQAEADVAE